MNVLRVIATATLAAVVGFFASLVARNLLWEDATPPNMMDLIIAIGVWAWMAGREVRRLERQQRSARRIRRTHVEGFGVDD